ncbi:MAG: UDP-N-acetylmuramoyl-tripeptide--D-alanyl-D-alanine ligase [Elusimicrobia bacterium]|nr:MAG: UDP-N-acetylmuramoyl-tripeptide--D-alanyl-D-alanine ligase [Elusimicrobiota bacterium]KAF0155863.1 MAG: UDP-N-acetylmuramoyl-tripeptide--D-alanyl-D-alanine ligase [Elusimicrobiota bacterium]
MKLGLDLERLADAAGGKLLAGDPRAAFDSFVLDSRSLKAGEYFWALAGEKHDAHAFLAGTLKASPAGWICREDRLPAGPRPPAVVAVKDTLKALQALAAFHRRRFSPVVAAVTGSNGKTTVKEMLRSIFARGGPVCSNAGNFNNQFGLPLSLLELGAEHRRAVFELGASRRGDVREIAELAAPDIAVVTTIAPEHLEFFGDMEAVFETETEVLDCLAPGGTFVYNADDERLRALGVRPETKLSFGTGPGADARAESRADGFYLAFRSRSLPVRLPSDAAHNRLNAAAAFAAALAAGFSPQEAVDGLEAYSPPPMRMQELTIAGSRVLLDAYNANPQSMAAALAAAAAARSPRYLALGDMKELGRFSEKYHRELAALISAAGPAKVFLGGPEMRAAADELAARFPSVKTVHADDPSVWRDEFRHLVSAGDGFFLVKASRSMRFENLLEGL